MLNLKEEECELLPPTSTGPPCTSVPVVDYHFVDFGSSDEFVPQHQNQQPPLHHHNNNNLHNSNSNTYPQHPATLRNTHSPPHTSSATTSQCSSPAPSSAPSSSNGGAPPTNNKTITSAPPQYYSSPTSHSDTEVPTSTSSPYSPAPRTPGSTYGEPEQLTGSVVDQIWGLQAKQQQQFDELRQRQRLLLQNPTPSEEDFNFVYLMLNNLKAAIDSQYKAILLYFKKTVMSFEELSRWSALKQRLEGIQSTQLKLFERELLQLTPHRPEIPECYVALVITEGPASECVFKGKQFQQPWVLHLVTGANVDISYLSKVTAQVISESTSLPKGRPGKKRQDFINSAEQSKFLQQGQTVQFHPHFTLGTRKTPATIKFSLTCKVGDNPTAYNVESEQSQPFIVITNENQWDGSESALIKKEAFNEREEVMWPQLANVLHMHLVRATRQDPNRPERTLHYDDFAYLHEKFFKNSATVTQSNFDQFWDWFSKGLHAMRYQKHVNILWREGLIYGFCTKETTELMLHEKPNKTYIIRLSEQHGGSYAIAYRHKGQVKHYLVRTDQMGHKKSLPEFLLENTIFKHCLQLYYEANRQPTLRLVLKDAALERFKPGAPAPPPKGYDELPADDDSDEDGYVAGGSSC
ncbi:hypothetical protein QOT17_004042 [Balamuthia mandrillaris]